MIFTRFGGNGVEIIKANQDGTVDIKYLNEEGTREGVAVYDLIADDGLNEISEAINEAADAA